MAAVAGCAAIRHSTWQLLPGSESEDDGLQHWFFLNGGMDFDSDVKNPKCADFYGPAKPDNTQPDKEFLDDWLLPNSTLIFLPRMRIGK